MNIQTERLENHIARLTVEIEDKRWEQAKHTAARELSRRYRIPGFRKGKAPYNIIVRTLGEAPIIESAVEKLGNEIYKDALERSEINPFAAGSLEDFQLEPTPTYIFTVPMQPEVDLGDYRAIRLDFEEPEVTDEQVKAATRALQHERALVEDTDRPVQAGYRVTVDIHSEFANEPPEAQADDETIPQKGDEFLHRHDVELTLDPEYEPVLPGFIEAMIGAEIDEEREFDLIVPDDDPDYESIAGRTVHVHVVVKNIQNVTLPELSDDFAARVTEDEDEPLTLLELRMRLREDLQNEARRRAEDEYSSQVLDAIIERATIAFPEALVHDRIHDMIGNFDNSLQQQGMNLETYQKITGITHDDLHEQFQEQAERSVKQTLVLAELIQAEEIAIADADVTEAIELSLEAFGEQAEAYRPLFDTPETRENLAANLLYRRVMERLVKIGRGEPLDEEPAVLDEAAGTDAADIDEEAGLEPESPDDTSHAEEATATPSGVDDVVEVSAKHTDESSDV